MNNREEIEEQFFNHKVNLLDGSDYEQGALEDLQESVKLIQQATQKLFRILVINKQITMRQAVDCLDKNVS